MREIIEFSILCILLIITVFILFIGLITLDEYGDKVLEFIGNKITAHLKLKTVHSESKTVHSKCKTGHWIILDDIWTKCSECGLMFRDVYDLDNYDNYCRHCGAKMEGLKYN